ncbi:MAG: penicillin-binding protein 2 [Alphaproteobacteria bacterium]|nr:penicillin-binding protein 2 [Alphaproteobacteria bacterium]
MVLALLLVVAFGGVAARLVEITVMRTGGERAAAREDRHAAPAASRAEIVDRNGTLLATTLAAASLFANPRKIADAEDAAQRLAAVLPDIDRKAVAARLKSDRGFVWLRRGLTPRQHAAVHRLGIPGFEFVTEPQRVYPHGALTAHIVGTTDVDNLGLSGIERSFDGTLRDYGGPLELSVDVRVQHVLREEIAATMAAHHAIGAAGIILDAQTSEIVAMVSLPDFDPLAVGLAPAEARFNRNTLGLYEMGSTFKIFTTAMVLDTGRGTFGTAYDASEPIQVASFTIRDFHGQNRRLTLQEVFKYSSNIGAVRMAVELGLPTQRSYLGKLGLLQAPTVELPEVGAPLVPKPWLPINGMTIAFGHGIAVSPLQAANAVAAIVNGGVLRPPTLVRRPPGAIPSGERVISLATSEKMRKLMRLTVVEGTGKRADVPGYVLGGKTGTAEKNDGKRYSDSKRLANFVGAFPIHAPRFVVQVLIDEPKGVPDTNGQATGGVVAAPVVARIVARAAPLLGVEPVDVESPRVRDALTIAGASPAPRGRNLAAQ